MRAGHEPYPHTPDGRYFVVRGRLWRLADPALDEQQRQHWVSELMAARRNIATARGDEKLVARARAAVGRAKRALGERGPVWWTDGAPDYNRRSVANTPYAAWFAGLGDTAAVRQGKEFGDFVVDDSVIASAVMSSLSRRREGSSTCPSEIARTLAPGDEARWRSLMPRIRGVLVPLVRSKKIKVTRGAVTLQPDEFEGGPIRIRRGSKFP